MSVPFRMLCHTSYAFCAARTGRMIKLLLVFILCITADAVVHAQLPGPTTTSTNNAEPNPPMQRNPNGISLEEMKEYGAAHMAATRANPDLAKTRMDALRKLREFMSANSPAQIAAFPALANQKQQLVGECDAARAQMNAAIIAVDPNVAPIIAKLELMHQKAEAMAAMRGAQSPMTSPPALLSAPAPAAAQSVPQDAGSD